jgi:hypothetical protein
MIAMVNFDTAAKLLMTRRGEMNFPPLRVQMKLR